MKLFFLVAWPHSLMALIFREKIKDDLDVWVENNRIDKQLSFQRKVLILLHNSKEFRNLLYYRIEPLMNKNFFARQLFGIMKFMLKPVPDLFIWTTDIGAGFYISHGNGAFIGAKRIGKKCSIHHQVTIGHNFNGNPVIGDNVYIGVGAKVIGNITIGNNVKIGANAVVVKDVPDDCTVVGVPAKIVKQNGKKLGTIE